MSIKQEIQECKNSINFYKDMIKDIKSRCKHENINERHYVDYDRNLFEIKCLDCDKILFDGNQNELNNYKNKIGD